MAEDIQSSGSLRRETESARSDELQKKRNLELAKQAEKVSGEVGKRVGGQAAGRSAQTGARIVQAPINVAGKAGAPFTGGVSEAGSQAVRFAGRQAAYQAGKQVGKTVGEQVGKAPARALRSLKQRDYEKARRQREGLESAAAETDQDEDRLQAFLGGLPRVPASIAIGFAVSLFTGVLFMLVVVGVVVMTAILTAVP